MNMLMRHLLLAAVLALSSSLACVQAVPPTDTGDPVLSTPTSPPPPGAGTKKRSNTLVIGALVGVAALVGIGLALTRGDDSKTTGSTTLNSTQTTATTLPAATSSTYPEGTLHGLCFFR